MHCVERHELAVLRRGRGLKLFEKSVQPVEVAVRHEMTRQPGAQVGQRGEQRKVHAQADGPAIGSAVTEQEVIGLVVQLVIQSSGQARNENFKADCGNGLVGDVGASGLFVVAVTNPQVKSLLHPIEGLWTVAQVDC